METIKQPGVGVGVMILNKKRQLLLGKRNVDPKKASSLLGGQGSWTMPGGKVELLETLTETAIRETKEETGISLNSKDLKVMALNEDIFEKVHFITIGFLYQNCTEEPKVLEPETIIEWDWFDLDKLPTPLFIPSEKILKNYKEGKFHITKK